MKRFIVKPQHFRKSPLALKRAIPAAKLVSYPGRYQPALDYRQDVFLAYPPIDRYPNRIANVPASYGFLSRFYTSDKHTQRSLIRQTSSLRTPESYASTHFIVRPLRHFGGFGYRITDDPADYNPATEYIAPAFAKKREYRSIFVMGTPLILLRKKPGPDAGPFDAWNHTTGSFFQTVNDVSASPLSSTSFFADASSFVCLRDTHLIAVDVLLGDDHTYAVTELNFSPALSIESNLERIAHALAYPPLRLA